LLTANPAQDIADAIDKKTDPFSAAMDPKGYAAKNVAPELERLEKLKQLVQADPAMIQRIGGLKSIQEAQQARINARNVIAASEDPKTRLGEMVARARKFRDDPVGERNKTVGGVARGAYNLGSYAYNRGADALTSAQQYLLNLNKPTDETGQIKIESARNLNMNIAQQIFAEQAHKQFRQKLARCWKGYEPVPGTTPYTEGSCRPAGSKKTKKEVITGKKKTEKKSVAILATLFPAKTAEFSDKPFDPMRGPQLPGKANPQQTYNHQLRRSREIVQKQQQNPKYVPPGWYAELNNYYGGKMPARPAMPTQPAQPTQTAAVQAVKPAMPTAPVSRPQTPPTTPLKRPTMTQMPPKSAPAPYPSPRNLAGNRLPQPSRSPIQGTR
jgi:hypothetical protein